MKIVMMKNKKVPPERDMFSVLSLVQSVLAASVILILFAFTKVNSSAISDIRDNLGVIFGEDMDIGGYFTKPCKISMITASEGEITLTEGKYHQIKRMLEAVNNKITYLERISFGDIFLDPSLERGQWRYLTSDEEKIFLKTVK